MQIKQFSYYTAYIFFKVGGLSSCASVVARSGIDGDGTEIRRPAERHQGHLPSIGDPSAGALESVS